MGLLKRKTRLVTMHQLQYLKHADVVYCMRASAQRSGLKCTIAASGTLKELMVRACMLACVLARLHARALAWRAVPPLSLPLALLRSTSN